LTPWGERSENSRPLLLRRKHAAVVAGPAPFVPRASKEGNHHGGKREASRGIAGGRAHVGKKFRNLVARFSQLKPRANYF